MYGEDDMETGRNWTRRSIEELVDGYLKKKGGGGGGKHSWSEGTFYPSSSIQLVAPSYGVFINGVFTKYIDVSELTFEPVTLSGFTDFRICQIPGVEVRPYMPKLSDNYFDWNPDFGTQQELSWITDPDNGCIIETRDRYMNIEVVGYLPPNIDLSRINLGLVNCTYDLYIVERDYAGIIGYNLKNLYEHYATGEVETEARDNDETKITRQPLGIYGLIGDANSGGGARLTSCLAEDMCSGYDSHPFGITLNGTENKFLIGGCLATSPGSEDSFSGQQKISHIYTNAIDGTDPTLHNIGLPGFRYGESPSIPARSSTFSRPNQGDYINKIYTTMWIMRELRVEPGTIVGH